MVTIEAERLQGYSTSSELSVWAQLPGWRMRKELEVAELAGAIKLFRVGRYRLLSHDQRPALEAWLKRRGLWTNEAA